MTTSGSTHLKGSSDSASGAWPVASSSRSRSTRIGAMMALAIAALLMTGAGAYGAYTASLLNPGPGGTSSKTLSQSSSAQQVQVQMVVSGLSDWDGSPLLGAYMVVWSCSAPMTILDPTPDDHWITGTTSKFNDDAFNYWMKAGSLADPFGFFGIEGAFDFYYQPTAVVQLMLNIPANTGPGTYMLVVGDINIVDWSYNIETPPNAQFTVTISGGSLPGPPTNPNPTDGATNVSTSVTLDWADASGATSYDVYLGTGSGPPYLTNVTSSSYTPSPCACDTQYYWKIVSRNASGTTSGPVWSFRTKAAPSIIQQPLSQTASSGPVTFSVTASDVPPLSYQWRKYNGSSWDNLADGGNVAGATTTTLSINPIGPSDAGSYDVVVSNACDSATSDAATLTVVSCTVDWRSGIPGLDSDVYAMTVWEPDGGGPEMPRLVVGGAFTSAGGTAVNHIAAWDGASWQPLSSGMQGTSPNPHALTVYQGELIAAGDFTVAGGSPANRIARWNGTSWQTLGDGVDDSARAVGLYQGELIVGGVFTSAGGVPVSRIARWNGTSWNSLGTGMNGEVRAIMEYGGELIVGGYFTSAGGTLANGVARWNGTTWSPLGSGVESPGQVQSLAEDRGDLIVGGSFSIAGGSGANNIAKWNGTAWAAFADGTNGSVHALFGYAGDLFAGGEFTSASGTSASRIARWDGASWQALGAGTDGVVWDLAEYNGDLIAAGEFTTAGGLAASNIARWSPDGAAPTITQQPMVRVTCAGDAATFTVSASGTGLTYQWRKNGADITDGPTGNASTYSGTTSPMLSVSGVTVADATADAQGFDVVISGVCEPAATSARVGLTVNTAPAISAQPLPATVCVGAEAVFAVTAGGSGLTYQWRKNGTDISDGPTGNGSTYSGTTSSTLTISGVTTADSAASAQGFDVVLSGLCSPAATSVRVALTVNSPPSITAQPQDTTVCAGHSAIFSVTVSGQPAPTHQWQVSTDGGTVWTEVSGATASNYALLAAIGDDGHKYRCVASNACGAVPSSAGLLTVIAPPTIDTQPIDAITCMGAEVTFSMAATGATSYQWQVRVPGNALWNDIPEATGLSYTLTARASEQGKKYRCVLSNTWCTVYSNAASLRIVDADPPPVGVTELVPFSVRELRFHK